MANILSPTELKYLLIDSLKAYSEDTTYLRGNNPYTFIINKKVFHIFIHNVHDSGSGRTNPDECRIQVGRSKTFQTLKQSRDLVLFLGYYASQNVFTAWNPFFQSKRINEKSTVSFYSRFSIQKKAAQVGIALYVDVAAQRVITFKPEYLGLYLENFNNMHASDEKTLVALIKESDQAQEIESGKGVAVTLSKKKFVITHKVFKRSAAFKNLVYDRYDGRCAFSDIQLNLVEAAHIVPISHAKGSDDVRNGICLSALHHKAFDDGLVFIDTNFNIKLNQKKIDYLTKINKDGGLIKFIQLNRSKMRMPSSHVAYPTIENIQLANHIRGIN